MNLLFGYTLDYIKRNRRGSIAIMVAILMTTTMMSALCGFLYTVYVDNLNLILHQTGNWHGELYDITLGKMLPTIESFDSVESTMIKGSWKTAQIDDPRRDYLVWRDANAEYWESMPEGDDAILEGRAPVKVGEIAMTKQYFEHHPNLKMGDTITLPVGNRVDSNGNRIDPVETAHQGESFVPTDSVTLTIVGKLDVATSSTIPAYTALGYFDTETILPEDDLTVYLRFHNIRDTYKELPKIAEAVGYQKDEYGNYLLRYNTTYLVRKAVLPPEETGVVTLLLANQAPLMFLVMGLFTVGMFVLIIHNAFSLSLAARLTHLGIFASVGATPKQIKRSVVMEALLLTVIPLPFGLLLGQAAIAIFVYLANNLVNSSDHQQMLFSFGWQSILPAILLSVTTVWWSALIPARKIDKMSPIAAIRQGEVEPLKKTRHFSIFHYEKWFGIFGELAANAFHARKKSYRTATISLTISLLTLACFFCINSAVVAHNEVYQVKTKQWAEQDILISLKNVATLEDFTAVTERIHSINGMDTAVWYNSIRTASWIPENGFSTEFEGKGGYPAIEKLISNEELPLLRDGKRRVNVTLLGLDDTSFSTYCNTLGLDPEPFYEKDHWSGILYNTVEDLTTTTLRNPTQIPFLDIAQGDTLSLTEKTSDSYEGDFAFDMEVSAITDQFPPVGNLSYRRYSVIQVLPMSQLRQLVSNFARNGTVNVGGVIQVSDPSQITPVRNEIEQICESYFGSGDYNLLDENEYFEDKASGEIIMTIMFSFIAILLLIIGLSNAWSTVRGTLNARRREFAMLRSVGLPPRGLRQMLLLEALMLGLTPILLGLPVVIILQGMFLSINEITFFEWLPYAPWLPVLLYTAAVLTVIVTAYIVGNRKIQGENIIEAIKIDSI